MLEAAKAAKQFADEFKRSNANPNLKESLKQQEKLKDLLNKLSVEERELLKLRQQKINTQTRLEKITREQRIEVEKLKTKESELTQTIRNRVKANKGGNLELEKSKLRLREVQKQTKLTAREQLGLVGAYERLNIELSEVRVQFKNAASQYGINSKEAQKYKTRLDALDKSLKRVDKAAGQSQRNVGNYGSTLAGVGRNLIGAFGVVGGVQLFANVLRSSAATIKEYDSSQANLRSILQQTKEETKELSDLTLELGSTTAFTATEATNAATELAKLGFVQSQIQDSLGGVLDASIAFGAELPETAALVASTLKAFNLDASETDRVVSTLAVSTTKSALDFSKLQTALANVAPAAAAANFSVEKTTALLGLIVDKGIDASTAGTQLRNIFIQLSKDGTSLEEALDKIGTSQDKLTTANELFGKRAAVTAIALADQRDKIESSTLAITGQDQALEALVNERLNTLDGALRLLNSAWEGLILSFENGDGVLAEIFIAFIQNITNSLNGLQEFSDLTKEVFGDVIVLLKELGIVSDESSSEVQKMTGAFVKSINPFKMAIDQLKLLRVAFFRVTQVVKSFKLFIQELGGGFSQVGRDLSNFKGNLKGLLNFSFSGIFDSFEKGRKKILKSRKVVADAEVFQNKIRARKLLESNLEILKNAIETSNQELNNTEETEREKTAKIQEQQRNRELARQKARDAEKKRQEQAKKEAEERAKAEIESLETSLEFFLQTNESKLDKSKSLSQALIDIEKNRLDEILAKEIEIAQKKAKLNESEVENKIANNEKLTTAEQAFYTEVLKLRSENEEAKAKIDKDFAKQTLKEKKNVLEIDKQFALANTEDKEAVEIEYQRKVLELNKEALENEFGFNFIRLNAKKELTGQLSDSEKEYLEIIKELNENDKKEKEKAEEDELEKEKEKKEAQEDAFAQTFALIEKEREARELVSAFSQYKDAEDRDSKIAAAGQAAGVIADIAGRETAFGKAAAVAQTTINTFQAASKALASLPPPLSFAAAAAATTFGFLQVKNILSTETPRFAKGKNQQDNYEGLAFVDEQGAEIHTNKDGQIKSLGQNKGARLTYVEKDDMIYPASISKKILGGNLRGLSNPVGFEKGFVESINLNFQSKNDIDYDKLAKKIAKENAKNPTKNIINYNGQLLEVQTQNGSSKKRFISNPNSKIIKRQNLA